MFRSLIFLIAIGLVVWLISRMIKNRSSSTNQPKTPQQIKTIVQCQQCHAFIPEDKVIEHDGHIFCSQKHLDEWKDSH